MMDKQEMNRMLKEEAYLKQIKRLQKTISLYEQLAEKVRSSTVMDSSIYTDNQDPDWLSIDRDDYAKIMDSLSKIDLWKPWENMIQSRLTK